MGCDGYDECRGGLDARDEHGAGGVEYEHDAGLECGGDHYERLAGLDPFYDYDDTRMDTCDNLDDDAVERIEHDYPAGLLLLLDNPLVFLFLDDCRSVFRLVRR